MHQGRTLFSQLLQSLQEGLGFSELRTWVSVFVSTPMSEEEAGDLTPGDFLDGVASSGTLTRFWQVDRQRLDVFMLRKLLPRHAAIEAAIHAGETAGQNVARIVRVDGDRPHREILQPLVAALPGQPAVGRDGA